MFVCVILVLLTSAKSKEQPNSFHLLIIILPLGNLNTDVLLGLLSVALPMRSKASEEGSLPPLKLVIMSATLKVEDFTENTRLFPNSESSSRPALVTVPGRTHPVSIHHSKVTELDDYGKCV